MWDRNTFHAAQRANSNVNNLARILLSSKYLNCRLSVSCHWAWAGHYFCFCFFYCSPGSLNGLLRILTNKSTGNLIIIEESFHRRTDTVFKGMWAEAEGLKKIPFRSLNNVSSVGSQWSVVSRTRSGGWPPPPTRGQHSAAECKIDLQLLPSGYCHRLPCIKWQRNRRRREGGWKRKGKEGRGGVR